MEWRFIFSDALVIQFLCLLFVLFRFALLFTLTVFLLGHMCRQPPMPSQARKPSFLKRGLRESFPGEQPWALGREVAELWDGFPSMADLLAVHSAAWLSSWALRDNILLFNLISNYFLLCFPFWSWFSKRFPGSFLWSSSICAVKPQLFMILLRDWLPNTHALRVLRANQLAEVGAGRHDETQDMRPPAAWKG